MPLTTNGAISINNAATITTTDTYTNQGTQSFINMTDNGSTTPTYVQFVGVWRLSEITNLKNVSNGNIPAHSSSNNTFYADFVNGSYYLNGSASTLSALFVAAVSPYTYVSPPNLTINANGLQVLDYVGIPSGTGSSAQSTTAVNNIIHALTGNTAVDSTLGLVMVIKWLSTNGNCTVLTTGSDQGYFGFQVGEQTAPSNEAALIYGTGVFAQAVPDATTGQPNYAATSFYYNYPTGGSTTGGWISVME